MKSLTDFWWHRLFRIIQIMLGLGLFTALLITIIGAANQSDTKTKFLLSSDKGYSDVLATQHNNSCFGKYGVAVLGPTPLKEQCAKQMNGFIKSPFAERLVPNLDAQDLGTIQNGMVTASQMQQHCPYFSETAPGTPLYEKYFDKGSPRGTLSYRTFQMDQEAKNPKPSDANELSAAVLSDPKICDWFLNLNKQDSEYLGKINTVTYKQISTDEEVSETRKILSVGLTIFLPLLSILALEIVYRLILFVAHGREALRINLK